MLHEHHHWHSAHLGREMHLDVWGHAGARVIVFPTTMGTWSEWPDRRMPEVLAEHLENGWIQMYFLDQVHDESWYGKHLHPGARAWRHLQYDAYAHQEVLPFSQARNGNPFVIVTGASFGAYHAATFAFRHPESVNRMIGMSGLYDVKHMTDGYSDQHVYAANPFDFMRHEWESSRLAGAARHGHHLRDRAERSVVREQRGAVRDPVGQGHRERAPGVGRACARLAVLGAHDQDVHRRE